MKNIKLNQAIFILFIGTLGFGISNVSATVVPTNWFSNTTSISNIIDPPGPTGPERFRLQEGFLTGFAEGTVVLPFVAEWTISSIIRSDGQFDLPDEFVKIFIDDFTPGNEVAQFFNTPVSTDYFLSHTFTGDQFNYRFEFSSTSTIEHSHLIVQPGTVSTLVPEPGTLTLFGIGFAVLGLVRRRRLNY